jgi:DNA-directed RNA polymerase subunit RPC12/RpoP
MNRETAEFWAKTITNLFAGRQALFVDSFQGQKPSIIVTKIREAKSFSVGQDNQFPFRCPSCKKEEKKIDMGTGTICSYCGHVQLAKFFFHVTSDYGVHDGLDRVTLDLENHTIVMRATDQWRMLFFLDKCSFEDHDAWMKAQEEADETNP